MHACREGQSERKRERRNDENKEQQQYIHDDNPKKEQYISYITHKEDKEREREREMCARACVRLCVCACHILKCQDVNIPSARCVATVDVWDHKRTREHASRHTADFSSDIE